LVYGEIHFEAFRDLIRNVSSPARLVFYDLGCGVGKAIITAAIAGTSFQMLTGVEILHGLQKEANRVLDKYRDLVKDGRNIRFVHADAMKFDFSDGDVIFVPSTCYTDEMMITLGYLCCSLKKRSHCNNHVWTVTNTHE